MRHWNLSSAACLLLSLVVRPAAAGAQEAFTLAVLPDVQQEVGDTRLRDRLRWLVDHREALNLRVVLQVGDLMNFNDEAQYEHHSDAFRVLDEAGLPYVTCLGNHDTAAVLPDSGSAAPGNVNLNLRNTERYNRHFPLIRFTLLAETYEPDKIDNACHRFTAGGLDWLVINLELWARGGVVAWARRMVEKYADHQIIFLTHAHLNADGTIGQNNGGYGDNSPRYVFDQAMRPYPNVRLVFSGHTGVHGYRTDVGEQGNTIHQFLQCYHDPQGDPTRLVTIDRRTATITSRVHCPRLDRDKEDGSAFTITDVPWLAPGDAAVGG